MSGGGDEPAQVAPRLRGTVGVLGDVHAEDGILATFLDALQAVGVSETLCVGDIVDGRGDLGRTVELLARYRVQCVRGNHDRWAVAGTLRDLEDAHRPTGPVRAFLAGLPPIRQFQTPLGGLLLCHGVGPDDMAELTPDTDGYALQALDQLWALQAREDVAVMVGGHTHRAMVRRFPELVVVNAGTLRRAPGRPPLCLALDLERARVRRFVLRDTLEEEPGESLR